MSVYTELSQNEIEQLLGQYDLGTYVSHQGISGGVENTNYFVSTDRLELVLTLFEKHQLSELPFYLKLGEHLHAHHCKVPQPYRNLKDEFLQVIKGKPAVFVERASGGHIEATQVFADEIAIALAEVHTATSTFVEQQDHSHGVNWVILNAKGIEDSLSIEDKILLNNAVGHLLKIPSELPKGIIHGDLFHDNALFDNGHISAIIDWYFAGYDCYALDIAIALNDWCLNSDHAFDLTRIESFVDAYQTKRALTDLELISIPLLQIQAATRFWISRLLAQREHSNTVGNITVKDPNEMKQLLVQLLDYTEN